MGAIIIGQNARGRCGITRNSRESCYNTRKRDAVLIKFARIARPTAHSVFGDLQNAIERALSRTIAHVLRTVDERKLRILDTMRGHSSKQQPERALYLENWSSAPIQPLENRWSFFRRRDRPRNLMHFVVSFSRRRRVIFRLSTLTSEQK